MRTVTRYGVSIALSAAYLLLPSAARAATYYVNPAGNDANSGTSSLAPWKTLNKVNATTFRPGDFIRFLGGATWTGQLHPLGSGTSASSITLTTYATGQARIDGGGIATAADGSGGGAILLRDQSYWNINGFEVTNKGPSQAERVGVLVTNQTPGSVRHGIVISNLYVHDVNGIVNGYYGRNAAIAVTSNDDTDDSDAAGCPNSNAAHSAPWTDVSIIGNRISMVDRIGVYVGPAWQTTYGDSACWPYLSRSNAVSITFNHIADTGGDGILVNSVSNASIAYNTFSNGGTRITDCPNSTAYCSGAVAGIWTNVSNDVTVEHNEVYNFTSATSDRGLNGDGEAFDIDQASTAINFQYNYSHDNKWGMLLLCDALAGNPIDDTHVRYNVSFHDGGAFVGPIRTDCGLLGSWPTGADPLDLNNNTFVLPAGANHFLYNFGGAEPPVAFVYNNIFYSDHAITWVPLPNTVFDYNVYNQTSGNPSDPHAIAASPGFQNLSSMGVGNASGVQLLASSPAIKTGTDTGAWNIGPIDYWGNAVSPGPVNIGAYDGAPIATHTNVALGATVVPSSSYEGLPWGAANVVDGQEQSYNSTYGFSSFVPQTDQSHAEDLELRFGSSKTFNTVVLYPRTDPGYAGAGFPIDFVIQVWDGASWMTRRTLIGYLNPGSAPQMFHWTTNDVTDRVRIHATKLGAAAEYFALQFAEVEVSSQ